MAISLERRIGALESQRGTYKPAAHMTDRELLAIVAPDYTGHIPIGRRIAGHDPCMTDAARAFQTPATESQYARNM